MVRTRSVENRVTVSIYNSLSLSTTTGLRYSRFNNASTAMFVTGEFGRTPKINKSPGRDHYPRSMCCLLGEGGIKGGQVVGESDARREDPKDRVITQDDVAATFYKVLGIDPYKEYHTPSGRPVMITRYGKMIPELTG